MAHTLSIRSIAVAAMLALSTSLSAFAQQETSMPIKDFHVVAPGRIYRGAKPESVGVKALAALGVKTILDFQTDRCDIGKEKKAAAAVGINFYSIPLSSILSPDDATIDSILETMSDPDYQPVYVHCRHGHDRTGMIVGLYRVLVEGHSPEWAKREMLRYGFHTALIGLNSYYNKRTRELKAHPFHALEQ